MAETLEEAGLTVKTVKDVPGVILYFSCKTNIGPHAVTFTLISLKFSLNALRGKITEVNFRCTKHS